MSWIYTLVMAGILFSSPGDPATGAELAIQTEPVSAVTVMSDESEKFDQTYPLNANGRVSVSNVNGSIVVEAWDRNEVRLEYTKSADSRERLADVEVRIDSSPERFRVETDYGSWHDRKGDGMWRNRNNGKLTVEYKLTVPRGAVLNEIETVNGSVRVSNFTNITKVSAVNGSVNASNIRGTASLSTVNGEVMAEFDQLTSGTKINLDTVNGKVNLTIPSDSNATIKADSLNGVISNDFGLPVHKGKYVGRDLYGRIGTGDVQIRLNSVNGALSIGRKDDGKNLSPATNLLPQKDKDDDDWDFDVDIDNEMGKTVDTEKMNRDIERAVRDAERETGRATRELGRNLENIAPTISKAVVKDLAKANKNLKIDTRELSEKIRESQMMQQEVMARMDFLNFTAAVPRVEKKSNSFTVKGVPKVTVDAKGCSVRVRGWDKSEVRYAVTQFAEARSREDLAIGESNTDSSVNITVRNPNRDAVNGNFASEHNRVRVDIYVPRKSNLKIDANGEIRIEGVSGEVELSGSDEAINIRDLDGRLRVTNGDGRIRVIGFRGELDATSVNGSMNLEGDFKRINAKAADGSIMLTLPENASADLIANCTELAGDGIELVRNGGDDKRPRYKIGRGGPVYDLDTTGEIQVRAVSLIRESL